MVEVPSLPRRCPVLETIKKIGSSSSTRSTSSPLPRWLVLRLTGQDGKELLQCQQQQDLLLRVHHRTRPLAAESPEASQTLMGSQTSCLNCGQASSQLKDSLAVWSLSPVLCLYLHHQNPVLFLRDLGEQGHSSPLLLWSNS